MNEQITNILNQRITKTSKIQQLLLLGLTRRQGCRPGNKWKLRFCSKRLQADD